MNFTNLASFSGFSRQCPDFLKFTWLEFEWCRIFIWSCFWTLKMNFGHHFSPTAVWGLQSRWDPRSWDYSRFCLLKSFYRLTDNRLLYTIQDVARLALLNILLKLYIKVTLEVWWVWGSHGVWKFDFCYRKRSQKGMLWEKKGPKWQAMLWYAVEPSLSNIRSFLISKLRYLYPEKPSYWTRPSAFAGPK